eukprot:228950_1
MISRHICNEAGTHYAQDLATHLLILKNRTEPKYHLYYGSKVIDAAFYATTNLLVSESIELTPQTNPIGNRIRIIATANIDNLPVPNNRQNQDDAKANDEAPRELQPQSTKQRLQLEYPCLMTFISHYPVRQIRELDDCIVFDLDKSPRGRYCRTISSMHKANNQYLTYFKDSKKVFQQCRDPDCGDDNSWFLWKDVDDEDSDQDEDLDQDIDLNGDDEDSIFMAFTDDGFAREFATMYDESVMCIVEDDKPVFLIHNGMFWEDDRTCLKLKRLISNEFQHCLQTKLRMQHEGGVINEATYKKARRSIRNKLETHTKKHNIIQTLPSYMTSTAVLDSDPFDITFTNGVWNCKTKTLRKSDPSEYCTNRKRTGWSFNSNKQIT